MAGKMKRPIGPYSRPGILAKLDWRTRDMRRLRAFIADMTAHLGDPSAVEREIISRAAVKKLRLEKFDERAFVDGGLSDRDRREAYGLENSFRRDLQVLGLERREPRQPSLQEYLRGKAADAA